MRIARAVAGAVLVLVSLPVILASGALWVAGRHQDPGGTFTARTEQLRTDGYALVVEDIDRLVLADAPFIRGGHTSINVTATSSGPLFIGLAPSAAARHYLAGVGYTQVSRVRPAVGALPVDLKAVEPVGEAGANPLPAPFEQPIWLAWSTGDTDAQGVTNGVTWDSTASHGQPLALVIMNGDGAPGLDLRAIAAIDPQWRVPSMWGMLVFGGTVMLFGVVVMAWPARPRREVVYLVDPDDLADFAKRLAAERCGARGNAALVAATGDRGRSLAGNPGLAVPADLVAAHGVSSRGAQVPETAISTMSNGSTASSGAAATPTRSEAVARIPDSGARDLSPLDLTADQPLDQRVREEFTARSTRRRSRSNRSALKVTPNWIALLASTRPPATPRLMWPPKKAHRTSAPVPVSETPTSQDLHSGGQLVEAGSHREMR